MKTEQIAYLRFMNRRARFKELPERVSNYLLSVPVEGHPHLLGKKSHLRHKDLTTNTVDHLRYQPETFFAGGFSTQTQLVREASDGMVFDRGRSPRALAVIHLQWGMNNRFRDQQKEESSRCFIPVKKRKISFSEKFNPFPPFF